MGNIPEVVVANRYNLGWAVKSGRGEFLEVFNDGIVHLFEQYLTNRAG